MKVVDRKIKISSEPQIFNDEYNQCKIYNKGTEKGIATYEFLAKNTKNHLPIRVKWRIPAVGVKGVWTSNALLDKRIRADWELPLLSSRISVDAPVLCVFGYNDENIMTVAASDCVNTLLFEAAVQEEDNHIHFCLTFFSEDDLDEENYSCEIRLDDNQSNFCTSLKSAADWLQNKLPYGVMKVPEYARVPLYSTWYSYHQNFTVEQLLEECKMSLELGYQLIIVDDGWQTMDGNRGYDFTGDWEPDRIGDVGQFVKEIQLMGMKIMLWFSVPFCGRKSLAYEKFRGKFLTESHPWAPVLDPRFSEVRKYLVNRYVRAVNEWGVDGLKLDFIDDFKVYEDTELVELNGRDTLSVNKGVEMLILEIRSALLTVKSEVLIEFRQKYIGPMLRHLGNMFRAFDCPNDALMNRVRTTDVKLLCGTTPVHSDMMTWNAEEPVEVAAFQFTSILFSVPQLSVKLQEVPHAHLAMIDFFTRYWIKNRSILLDGDFVALKPLSNYPVLYASKRDKCIYGIYEDICIEIDESFISVDIINAKKSEIILIEINEYSSYQSEVINCQGKLIREINLNLTKGIHSISIPVNGMLVLSKS